MSKIVPSLKPGQITFNSFIIRSMTGPNSRNWLHWSKIVFLSLDSLYHSTNTFCCFFKSTEHRVSHKFNYWMRRVFIFKQLPNYHTFVESWELREIYYNAYWRLLLTLLWVLFFLVNLLNEVSETLCFHKKGKYLVCLLRMCSIGYKIRVVNSIHNNELN